MSRGGRLAFVAIGLDTRLHVHYKREKEGEKLRDLGTSYNRSAQIDNMDNRMVRKCSGSVEQLNHSA